MVGADRRVEDPGAPREALAHSATRVVYFHHVGHRLDHYTSMSTDSFRRALDVLTEAAEVIDVREYLRDPLGRRDSVEDPDHSVQAAPTAPRRLVITFDDGYAETIDNVLDLLEARDLTACFFVVPSWFGTMAPHGWAPPSLVCADAAALRDAQDRGHAIASHTWSHQHLNRLPPSAAEAELLSSADALRQHGLGVGVEGVHAYPYGEPPVRRGLVRAGFCTDRAPSCCALCSPQLIRRVYLHSTDQAGWRVNVSRWW